MAQANGNVEVLGPQNTTPNVPASETDETVQLPIGEPTVEEQPQPEATGLSQPVHKFLFPRPRRHRLNQPSLLLKWEKT